MDLQFWTAFICKEWLLLKPSNFCVDACVLVRSNGFKLCKDVYIPVQMDALHVELMDMLAVWFADAWHYPQVKIVVFHATIHDQYFILVCIHNFMFYIWLEFKLVVMLNKLQTTLVCLVYAVDGCSLVGVVLIWS